VGAVALIEATVVVTYHNESQDVFDRAMFSVAGQAEEIIVVDDGSDSSPDVLRWGGGVRLVRVTNRGLPAARNTGLMLCETEAILFLDSDDWIADDYLDKTLPLLENADVVLTGLQEHGPHRNGTYFPGYNKPFEQVTTEDLWHMNLFYYCSLFRTQTLREVGGYNPLMAGPWNVGGGIEDWDLTLDLWTRGARFVECREVLFHYDTSNPQSMAHTMNRAALEAELRRHHRRD
jgi:glycosyltransferase involved in cell wall biosynthesis